MQFPKSQYYQGDFNKKIICYHHTMGYSAQSSIDWFIEDSVKVGTQYVIDRDGTEFELWEDNGYAFQYGLVNVPRRMEFEQCSIGIEIANLGPLNKLVNGAYIDQYKRAYNGEVFRCKYRGFEYWEVYKEAQYAKLREMTGTLAEKHKIKLNPTNHLNFDLSVFDKNTVITHVNVRKDKTDVSPAFEWAKAIPKG